VWESPLYDPHVYVWAYAALFVAGEIMVVCLCLQREGYLRDMRQHRALERRVRQLLREKRTAEAEAALGELKRLGGEYEGSG
jgi:heme exporter protein D